MSASKTDKELKIEDHDGHTARLIPRSCRTGKKSRLQDDSSDLVAATIAFADDVRCPFQTFPALLRHPKAFGGLDQKNTLIKFPLVDFEYMRTLPSKDLEPWAFNLTKANMTQFYNACPGWSWSDRRKKAELKHGKARFLVAIAVGAEQSTMAGHFRRPVGFIHMRYEIERDKPVLYIYEFQVEPDYQGLGLGQSMLTWVEALARHLNLRSLMLTVFKANVAAFRFYQKAGFTLDQDSPGLVDVEGSHGYEILSKAVV
jgi:ribosomal protein S18 acetylase RimI-like enzyme